MDGVSSELGEVLYCFDRVDESQAPNNRDGRVTQRGEGVGAGWRTHATRIFSKRSVPNTVQLVLDAPVETG